MILSDLEQFKLPDNPGVYFFMGGEKGEGEKSWRGF
jgi:hypothetical protein